MAKRRLIGVGMNADSSSYLIYSDDTPGRKELYLRHLKRTGNRPEALRRAGGLSRSVLSRWRKEDEEFRIAENDAMYESLAMPLRKIRDAAAKGDWKAAAFLLEKGAPEEFGKLVQIDVAALPQPSRLLRPKISEIPVRDIEGEYREVPDAPEDDQAEQEDGAGEWSVPADDVASQTGFPGGETDRVSYRTLDHLRLGPAGAQADTAGSGDEHLRDDGGLR